MVRLNFYTGPISLLCLFPFFWIYEVRRGGGCCAQAACPCAALGSAVPPHGGWCPLLRTHHQPANCVIPAPPPLPPQRERFLAYLPEHSQGVAFIMLASSTNAVLYNLVGAGGGCLAWLGGSWLLQWQVCRQSGTPHCAGARQGPPLGGADR